MSKYQLFKRAFLSKFNLNVGILIFCTCVMITLIGAHYVNNYINGDEKLPSDNYIELLNIYEPAATYIQATVSEYEFQDKYAKGNDHFDTKELIDLASKSFVEKVYVIDEPHINGLVEENDLLKIVSFPELISESPNYKWAYPGMSGFLISGRLPKDGKFEAVVSYKDMQTHWDYNGDIDDIIGKKIDINSNEYTVVGITDLPVVAISYQSDAPVDYGVIEVTEDSFEQLNSVLKYKLDNGWIDQTFDNIFILYKRGSTKDLLDYLVEHAPSYQYASNYVVDVVRSHQFKEILPSMLTIIITISAVYGLIVVLFGKKAFKEMYNSLKDLDTDSQLQRKSLCFYAVLLVDYILVLPVMLMALYYIVGSNIKFVLPFYLINIIAFAVSIFVLKTKET